MSQTFKESQTIVELKKYFYDFLDSYGMIATIDDGKLVLVVDTDEGSKLGATIVLPSYSDIKETE